MRSIRAAAAWFPVAAIAVSTAGGAASAHVLVPGLTGLPSLALHPFTTAETLLVVIALALNVVMAADRCQLLRATAVATGGALAGAFSQPEVVTWPGLWRVPLLLAFGLGALAVAGGPRHPMIASLVVAAASIAIGIGVAPERAGWLGTVEAGAGAAIACSVAIAIARLASQAPRSAIGRIAMRVAGAWIVAIAALGLAAGLR